MTSATTPFARASRSSYAPCRDEARLNPTGEAVIYPRLVGHLVNRLQIEDWYRHHPETDDVPLSRHHCSAWACPVPARPPCPFSWPRTLAYGTCASGSRRSRVRPPSTVDGPDPRVGRSQQLEQVGTREHVPSDVNGPMECLDLMALDFKTQMYHAFARIPTYAAWVTDATSRPPTCMSDGC